MTEPNKQQKIRYIVIQKCSNPKHIGALGSVNSDSNTPRDDEQRLISAVYRCDNCTFHSLFYCEGDLVPIELNATLTKSNATSEEKAVMFNKVVYYFLLFVLLATSCVNLYYLPDNWRNESFIQFLTMNALGLVALGGIIDSSKAKYTKFANMIAFVCSVLGVSFIW
ncbi:hypothetical protein LC147_27455 [Vibrio harveyi]|uniref:hypothetical protein n=1 Tax=Vibrio harveyi group TaxID=717610 RepID=UPI001BD36FBC|nr:hypothetical protein [Vibrio alginolyticus]MBS9816556.1 hypothetical protein [Vibrio alginolyticus]